MKDKQCRESVVSLGDNMQKILKKLEEQTHMESQYMFSGCYSYRRPIREEIIQINNKITMLFKYLGVKIEYKPEYTTLVKVEKEKKKCL